ncbi:MAG: hypothetical protein SF053_00605 [Bacteroidia bacterium]|nr:hypothetical protein [Bacteroidia bacterium]
MITTNLTIYRVPAHLILAFTYSLICLTSCRPSFSDVDCNTLLGLHNTFIANDTHGESARANDTNILIDYSGSMHKPIAEAIDVMYHIQNILKGNSCQYYRVGETKPKPIDINSQENELAAIASYNESRSLLDQALELIVEHPYEQSVLISDFELDAGQRQVVITPSEKLSVQTSIEFSAWAKPYFHKWITAGNQIDFFIVNFQQDNKTKHLYFAVFTPLSWVDNDNAIYKRMLSFDRTDMHHVSFSTSGLIIITTHEGKGFEDAPNYTEPLNYCAGIDFESYTIYAQSLKEYAMTSEDSMLLDGIKIKNSISGLSVLGLELKAQEVTDVIQERNRLRSIGDTTQADQELLPLETTADIWKALLLENGEVKIVFKSKMDGLSAIPQGDWIKIELYPIYSNFKLSEDQRNWLTWQSGGSQAFVVPALCNSIEEAMAEVYFEKPNKPLYTFYLHFQ